MSPEEIMDAYNVVIEDLQTNTANRAAAIGNSQRSLGTLAERVASPSGQTSGLANYTYDRTMRPVIDTLSASLTTTGKAQALENLLTTKLREAKNNYENSKNNYTVASTNPSGGNGGNNDVISNQIVSGGTPASQNSVPPAGTVLGVGVVSGGTISTDWAKMWRGGDWHEYDVVAADGQGGSNRYTYTARSEQDALASYYRDHPTSGSGNNGYGYSGGGNSKVGPSFSNPLDTQISGSGGGGR